MSNETEFKPEELEKDSGEMEEFANQLDDELRKPLLTEIARKKHWREKAKKETEERQKLEEELKKYREPVAEAQKNPSPKPQEQVDEMDVVLQLNSEGYSPSEIRDLRAKAKRYNVPISDLVNDPLVKSGLEATRAKAKSEQATPAPSNRSSGISVEGKSWSEMKPEERAANFSKIMAKGGNPNE